VSNNTHHRYYYTTKKLPQHTELLRIYKITYNWTAAYQQSTSCFAVSHGHH